MASSPYDLRSKKGSRNIEEVHAKTSKSSRKDSQGVSPPPSSDSERDRSQNLSHSTDDSDSDIECSPPSTAGSSSAKTPSPRFARKSVTSVSSPDDSSFFSSPEVKSSSQFHNESRSIHQKSPAYRQLVTARPHDERNWSSNGIYVVGFLAVLVLVIAVMLAFIFSYISRDDSEVKTTEFTKFVNRITTLELKFPSQNERTWKTLKSSVRHVLDGRGSEYPAVILFAVPKMTSEMGTCFARHAAKNFNNSSVFNEYIDCRDSSHLDPDDAKLNLDQEIRKHFATRNAVVIDHLEALSPKAALLLHGICDNDNAPFKEVFILLVFHFDIQPNIEPKKVEDKVKEYLMKELDINKVGALLTRIANNIIVIQPESKEQVDNICS